MAKPWRLQDEAKGFRYTRRLMEEAENSIVPFPGAIRMPTEYGEHLAEQEAWRVISQIRKQRIAEARRQEMARTVANMIGATIGFAKRIYTRLRRNA